MPTHHSRLYNFPETQPWIHARKRRPLRLYRVVTARDARWFVLGTLVGAVLIGLVLIAVVGGVG